MNEHLQLVREYHRRITLPQAEAGKTSHLSDMEIISYQAMLLEAGGEVLKAIKAGEMAEILLGLVDLAYIALAAIAKQGGTPSEQPISWKLDGFVLSVMQIVCDKINKCASGGAEDYSGVYCLCAHLARGFVNADFDKAFQIMHRHYLSRITTSNESLYNDTEILRRLKLEKSPDLCECLYE